MDVYTLIIDIKFQFIYKHNNVYSVPVYYVVLFKVLFGLALNLHSVSTLLLEGSLNTCQIFICLPPNNFL